MKTQKLVINRNQISFIKIGSSNRRKNNNRLVTDGAALMKTVRNINRNKAMLIEVNEVIGDKAYSGKDNLEYQMI